MKYRLEAAGHFVEFVPGNETREEGERALRAAWTLIYNALHPEEFAERVERAKAALIARYGSKENAVAAIMDKIPT